MRPTKPYRKSARVVGEVLGKFHPHGDQAVYDALVRMAQDFSMSQPLVAGHGNFGSLDADPPAAMRYTECRLQPVADAMLLADLSEDTVEFGPTFDDSGTEPLLLPARLPNLLLNGSTGIAVGMATSWPPHNLGEVADALALVARKPDATVRDIMAVMPGPDFPTGGVLAGTAGTETAYGTGNGAVVLRGRAHVEAVGQGKQQRQAIIVTEVPYMGNKATLVARIAELVNGGTLQGVSDVRDESDRDGVRVVVELKKGADADTVLAGLYAHTKLTTKFNINMIALLGKQPRTWTVPDLLREFVAFRCEVIEKRAGAQLKDAQTRAHIVDGLIIALTDMDATIAAIRAAKDDAAASAALQKSRKLSAAQAAAVLAMPLRRLTGLEVNKLKTESAELARTVADLQDLLAKRDRVIDVLIAEAMELKAKHGKPRRTTIVPDSEAKAAAAASAEEAIPNDPALITVSERGYVKRMRPEDFSAQRRNTRGKAGGRMRGDDALMRVISATGRDRILFFTERGRAFGVLAHDIPEGSRTSGGTPLPQIIDLAAGEAVTAAVAISDFRDEDSLVMVTSEGYIKRTPLSAFDGIRSNGLKAASLVEGESLRFVRQARPGDSVILAASDGRCIHFPADDEQLRLMGRAARGTRAMKFGKGATLVGLVTVPQGAVGVPHPGAGDSDSETDSDAELADDAPTDDEGSSALESVPGPWALFVSRKGLAKRVPVSEFRMQQRGGKGMIGVKCKEGDSLEALRVVHMLPGEGTSDDDIGIEVVVASEAGVLNRCRVADIPVKRRPARGVALMKLDPGDTVRGVCLVAGDGNGMNGSNAQQEFD